MKRNLPASVLLLSLAALTGCGFGGPTKEAAEDYAAAKERAAQIEKARKTAPPLVTHLKPPGDLYPEKKAKP
jgi:predicted small lipoprotein YifL